MKKYPIALAVVAALALGAAGVAEARDGNARHGAHVDAGPRHHAAPRGFQRGFRRGFQGGYQRGFKGGFQGGFQRGFRHGVKRGHYRHRHGGHWRRYHLRRHFYRHGHPWRPHHLVVRQVYPVYVEPPSHSLGFEVETKDFRFSVNKSG